MNKKNIVIIIIVLAVFVVGYCLFIKPSPISEISEPVPTETGEPQAKIDINAVCEGALAYKTFPDGASADAFVAECKEGKHPEVIDQYKQQMNLGDGAAI